MQNLIDKFQQVVESIENEHGPLVLFGLFLREDAFEKWDVIVSAKWLDPDSQESYRIVNAEIQKYIKNGNLMKLSRIVILSQTNPLVNALQNMHKVDGVLQIQNFQGISNNLSFNIRSAYLLKCSSK